MIRLNPHPIDLDGFAAARCLQPLDDELVGRGARGFCVRLGRKLWFCPEEHVLRADGTSAYKLHRGARYALAYHAYDADVLGRCGFDEAWAASLKKNNEAMWDRWRGQQAEGAAADLDRHGAPPLADRAARDLGRALTLAQAGGLAWAFKIPFAERRSQQDLENALIRFNSRAADERVQRRLATCGVSDEMLAALSSYEAELHEEVGQAAEREARAAQDTLPLRIAKGLVYADLAMLSLTARAELKETRWEFYQLGYLFDRAEPGARPAPVPEPATPPTPAPAPAPVALASAGAPGAATAGPGAAFTLPPPGTVLRTLPGKDGPPVSAVLQADGTVAWVVGAADATVTAPGPQRPAPRRRQRR